MIDQNLRVLRKKFRITQEQLAEAIAALAGGTG